MFKAVSAYLDRQIGLSERTEDLAARMRSEQVTAIVRLTPIMALGGTITACLLTLALAESRQWFAIAIWALVTMAVIGMGVRAWQRQKNAPRRRRGSPRLLRRAVTNAFLLGSCWGALPAFTYASADTTEKLIIIASIAGILAAGGLGLAMLPQAALAFILPIAAGSAFALFRATSNVEVTLGLMMVLYTGVLLKASLAYGRVFIANLFAEFHAVEQQQVVQMLLKSFEENASDWLWQVNARGEFEHISPRFAQVTGMAAARLEHACALALLRMIAGRSTAFLEVLLSFRGQTPFRDVEIRLERNGDTQWWKITGEPIYDDTGAFLGFHGVCSDITEGKLAAQRVAYLAHHDSLTGALNRARFNEELTEAIIAFEFNNAAFALFYLDLDRFKAVNDTMGHPTGDALLIEVVRRLEALLPQGCLLARLGGDEFCVLIEGDCSDQRLGDMAEHIIIALCTPFVLGDKVAKVGTSVGIARASDGAGTAEALHHQADLALYAAKQAGRGTFRFFTEDMDLAEREARELEADLAHAINRGEMEVHFQPIVNTQSARIAGFEALARWRHPIKGMIPPARFIPLAEKKGLIGEIGLFVLNESCRVAAHWPRHYGVAVNLSSRQFATHSVARDVRSALERSGLPPEQLELELTESILIEQPETVIETLRELKAMGVRIALDDFGTGYSSLNYLWRFPFDKIKIDGSFVAAIKRDAGARHILATVGTLAHSLGFMLTAERVETREEVEFLRTIACDFLQGYYFYKPLPESELAVCLSREIRQMGAEAQPAPAVALPRAAHG